MATIVYSLSAKKDKTTGKQEILMRFFHGRLNQRAKTNLFTIAEYWDEKNQCNKIPKIRFMSEEKAALVKGLQQVNKELEEISTFIQEEFIKAGAGKVELADKWLSSKLLDRIKIPKRERKSRWTIRPSLFWHTSLRCTITLNLRSDSTRSKSGALAVHLLSQHKH